MFSLMQFDEKHPVMFESCINRQRTACWWATEQIKLPGLYIKVYRSTCKKWCVAFGVHCNTFATKFNIKCV